MTHTKELIAVFQGYLGNVRFLESGNNFELADFQEVPIGDNARIRDRNSLSNKPAL